MNIFRYAFWGFIIILLLPTTSDEKYAIYGGLKKIGADFVSFCDRNPDVCQGVKDAVSSVVHKLNLGAEMVSDAMDPEAHEVAGNPQADGELPPLEHDPASEFKPAVYRSHNTLTDEDLRPQWQGPRT